MSEPQKKLVGIVVRKDGTVPFDDDVHPTVREHILAFLTENGHVVEQVQGTKHVRIQGWHPGKELHKPKA